MVYRDCVFGLHLDVACPEEHDFIEHDFKVVFVQVFGWNEVVAETNAVVVEIFDVVFVGIIIQGLKVVFEDYVDLADEF